MFGDTTLNCWSISDRARKLGNEMNRWKFSWRAVITVWIVRNRCKFPEKVQLVSPTSYLLQQMETSSDSKFCILCGTFAWVLSENFSTVLEPIFSLEIWEKISQHKNWQISCVLAKTPTTQNFVTARLTVYLSQPDTYSVIHPSRCWFQNENLLYQSGVRKKALS